MRRWKVYLLLKKRELEKLVSSVFLNREGLWQKKGKKRENYWSNYLKPFQKIEL